MMNVELNQSQQEMLLSERVYGKQALSVISVKLKLSGFHPGQVKEAVEKVFENADIFSAVLVAEEDSAYFVPGAREEAACMLQEAMPEEEAQEYMERRDRMPLNFPEELYAAEVLPLKEGGAMLYVRFHHILMDGYSMSLFAQRVVDVLSGKELEKSVFFLEAAQGECHGDKSLAGKSAKEVITEEEKQFWLDYFKDAEFEPALLSGTGKDFEKFSYRFEPEGAWVQELERFAAEHKVTVPYVLGAAYGVYLAQATGKRDAVFLMARLNREREEMRTLGCYTLSVPVRIRVGQEDTFEEICQKIQENARRASAHKGCGFHSIMKLLKEEGFSGQNLSEYAFNFYSYEIKTDLDTRLDYSLDYSVSGGINSHLRWNIFKKEGKFSFVFDLRKGIYEDRMKTYFADAIMDVLGYGFANCKIRDMPSVGEAEREYLLSVKGREIEIDPEATIPGLFRKAAAKYGRQPALYAGEDSCSFEELDRCSDRIARELLKKGVGGGDIVGFMLKRDIRLIPVMLGISKTGAAFLPIDPKYPEDRIRYILSDSEAKFLISSKDVEAAAGREFLEADMLIGDSLAGRGEKAQEDFSDVKGCSGSEKFADVKSCSGSEKFAEVEGCSGSEKFAEVEGCSGSEKFADVKSSSSEVRLAEAAGSRDAEGLTECADESTWMPEIHQEQRAYLIYTSGTTGRPKGVMLSHKGIANIVHPDNNPFNCDLVKNGKGIVAIGSICFDISLFEIFVPLLNGLFVELGNEKAMLDAGELAEHILRHGADILHCTPSRVVSYLENPRFIEALENNVKAMLLAGEQLSESLVRELKNRYGIRVYNGYGPTETTIGATITEAGDCKTIGVPIANTGILLLNEDRKLVPYGAIGEICVYGNGVGIGYMGRPEETDDKFILWGGKRLYRTGDMGHLDSEGKLIYHGRNDRQVKLRGLRIELSEIEKVMGAYPGVSQAACILRKVEKRDHLAGFYSVSQGSKISKDGLRAFMKKRLAAYMVPELLTELKEMPQTPGGKTDLKALLQVPVEYVRNYVAPANEIESVICNAFSQVLDVEQVGAQDNFFELGGDSLSAVELIAILEKESEEKIGALDYESLFRYPTPALLAQKISGNTDEQSLYSIDHLDYRGIDAYLQGNVLGKGDGLEVLGSADGKKNLGTVLLTGATGYLGIHILIELLQNPDICEKVYCLVRPKGRLSAEKRMKNTLYYYAENDFSEQMGDRWEVVEGDITEPEIFPDSFQGQIDTIINSAANVAHYAHGDALEQVNRKGVENLIAYAVSRKALFCHISTISVGGVSDIVGEDMTFSEENFYIGQKIDNQYIYSKYMAEYALLRAAVDQGLAVKIMRVGNLQGRSKDGEFQMNLKSNAFTRRLFSYLKIGMVPESVYHASVNFSPVDETAHMILVLAGTDTRYSVFHVYPQEEVAFASLFQILEKQGHKIEVVSEEAFEAQFQEMKQTKEGRSLVEGLLTESSGSVCQDIPVVQKLTNQLLALAGEAWLPVTEGYLTQYLNALEGLNM